MGLDGKTGSKDFDKLDEDEAMSLQNMRCSYCGTDWELVDLVNATSTPIQLEIAERWKNKEV
jgi:hypothetical protein